MQQFWSPVYKTISVGTVTSLCELLSQLPNLQVANFRNVILHEFLHFLPNSKKLTKIQLIFDNDALNTFFLWQENLNINKLSLSVNIAFFPFLFFRKKNHKISSLILSCVPNMKWRLVGGLTSPPLLSFGSFIFSLLQLFQTKKNPTKVYGQRRRAFRNSCAKSEHNRAGHCGLFCFRFSFCFPSSSFPVFARFSKISSTPCGLHERQPIFEIIRCRGKLRKLLDPQIFSHASSHSTFR